MKLILVRHGETIENSLGIIQGQTLPGTLSLIGLKQAEAVALRLRNEKISAVYSSDLQRAANTAKKILIYHSGASLTYVEELRERDFGSFGGRKKADVESRESSPEVETYDDMKIRARKILNQVYPKYKGKTILFVTHGAFLLAAVSEILGIPHDDILNQHGKFKNGSISIFEIAQNNKTMLHNCTEHLQQ